MSSLYRTSEDPVSHLGWRARSTWRRRARRIVAEHSQELLSHVNEFRGLPISGVATTPTGAVRITLPGWAITVVGVGPGPLVALIAAAGDHRCSLSKAGKYGRFWWLAIEYGPTDERRRDVILGSRLVLTSIEGGRSRFEAPESSPQLTGS